MEAKDLKRENDCWPTIAINTKAEVQEVKPGVFRWIMTVHYEGPDDVLTKKSLRFISKKKCTIDMFANYERVMRGLHDKLNKN